MQPETGALSRFWRNGNQPQKLLAPAMSVLPMPDNAPQDYWTAQQQEDSIGKI
jgi:hypothetical protein